MKTIYGKKDQLKLFPLYVADCAKSPTNCNAPANKCYPPGGGFFDDIPPNTAKICGPNEVCHLQPLDNGINFPACLADPQNPKPDHTICNGKGVFSFAKRWCPNNEDCVQQPGNGMPICMPKVNGNAGLEVFYWTYT